MRLFQMHKSGRTRPPACDFADRPAIRTSLLNAISERQSQSQIFVAWGSLLSVLQQDIAHAVMARRLLDNPACRPHGALGENPSVRYAVGKRQAL